jgi:multidrug resistance efflux pump
MTESRSPRAGFILLIVLLAGSIAASVWWFNRPSAPRGTSLPVDDGDVFCTGRVDSARQVIPLEPVQPGRVVAIGEGIVEGARVSAGQEVFRLDDATARARQAQAQAAVAAARIELEAARGDQARFPVQVKAKEHLLAAAAARVEAARKHLQQRLEQHSISPLGRAEQEALRAQVVELEELEKAERKQLDEILDREANGLGTVLRVRAAEAKLAAANADEQLAARAVADCIVTAPEAGTILRLQVLKGALIGPGAPIPPVVFAPAGPLVVRAEVDQESLGQVRAGQAAKVQDENRADSPVLNGRVARVAQWVAPRRALVLEPGELNDVRTVECVIEFEPPSPDPLWIGQRMRVRILRPVETSAVAGAQPAR